MTDENQEQSQEQETSTQEQSQEQQTRSLTGDALPDQKKPAFEPEQDKYHGLDPRMFGAEGLDMEGTKTVISELKEQKSLVEKQRDDFHKTLSAKGQVPKKVEDYIDKYANPRYEPLKANEKVSESMKQLAETFHKNGISPKDADKIYDDVFGIMEKAGIIDTRSKEEVEAEHSQWVDKQMELLGTNAQTIINDTRSFLNDFVGINEEQKKELIELMNTRGASFVNSLYAITSNLDFKRVPVATQASVGLEPDPILYKKFQEAVKAKDNYTMNKIIEDRAKAGRPANFHASATGG